MRIISFTYWSRACLQPWRKDLNACLEFILRQQMAETLQRITPGKVMRALRPSQVLLLHDWAGLGCRVSLILLREEAAITARSGRGNAWTLELSETYVSLGGSGEAGPMPYARRATGFICAMRGRRPSSG